MRTPFSNSLIRIIVITLLVTSVPASANRVIEYVGFKGKQQWNEALAVIEEEISDPLINDPGYLSDINMLGMDGLGNVAFYHGYTAEMDARAKEYYRVARKQAGDDDERQARALHGLFNYYSKSYRIGLAIPFIIQELELWKKLDNQYQIFINYDAMASAYSDMGEIDLRDYYRDKAFAIADDYFELGERPDDANEWLNYKTVIDKYIDDHARIMPAKELGKYWAKTEPIVDKYLSPGSISRYHIAKMFALNGQDARAQQLMDKAREIYEDEKDDVPTLQASIETDLACAQAQVDLEASRYQKAVEGFLDCREKWENLDKDLGGPTWGLLGFAFEKGGNLDDALNAYNTSIEKVETTRSSFNVAQRATFFRNSVIRRPYWGAIRIHSKRAEKSQSKDDFSMALQATERIRARQFGELLNEDIQQAISATQLDSIQEQIPAGTVIVDYIIADENIIILAFDKKTFRAQVLAYDQEAMRKRVRNISRQLATPQSKLSELQKNLLAVSQVIIAPVAGMLEGKDNVIVLPDRELNLIPFDLLSIDSKTYKPLVRYTSVSNLPSLRLLAAGKSASNNGGIFAVGDPVYPKLEEVLAVDKEAMVATTRNINLRGYFSPLPETRDEVEDIARLFGKKKNTLLLGDQATESAVKLSALNEYNTLHFATHGILGGEVPGIGEPALILSNSEYDDGFLKASEVEQLKLNANLVVLSACNTGSGRLFSGEGVMGMSRSFMLAGSESVVVSLWPVASKPTQDLMVRFYRHLNSGKPKARALRAAKLELMKSLPHPFFWSPFVMVGQQQ